jgi:hypothetical protein
MRGAVSTGRPDLRPTEGAVAVRFDPIGKHLLHVMNVLGH